MARTISEIQADLTAARNARLAALKAQAYSLDDGQGKQQVTRANLTELNKTIKALEVELEEAQAADSGLASGSFERY